MFKPTKKDLQRSVTLGDFVEFTDFATEHFATKADLAEVKDELKDEMHTTHDKVMKKLDLVLTEYAATNGNVDQYRDDVAGVKKRVERLEARAGAA